MAEQCFIKQGSGPPICGVHNVPLIKTEVNIDKNAPQLGHITCLRCPVSRSVILDAKAK